MKDKDTLYARWLTGDLSKEEIESLNKDGTIGSLARIIRETDTWGLPPYDTSKGLSTLRDNRHAQVVPIHTKRRQWVLGIAAGLFALIFIRMLFTTSSDIIVTADLGATKVVQLDEGSVFTVNDGSTITYDAKDWETERKVQLTGEALFEVNPGNPFIVETALGAVHVLGTTFNVRSWGNTLSVECYEGRVQVKSNGADVIINGGEGITFRDNELIGQFQVSTNAPSWLEGVSVFSDEDVLEVFKEVERQYDLEIEVQAVNRRFTGSFPHDNLEEAVSNICKPLGLQYNIAADGNSVYIKAQ